MVIETFDDILNRIIQEIDPESGESHMELIVRELVKVSTGKKGSARESVAAALGIIQRVAGETAKKPEEFFGALRTHVTESDKFKITEETGDE